MIAVEEQANSAQAALWNSRVGETWVALQQMLDRLFLPFERILANAVAASGARRVLDIGCGAGATSIAAAEAIAPQGRCTGVDVSVPLIEAARRRAHAEARQPRISSQPMPRSPLRAGQLRRDHIPVRRHVLRVP
jgi:2-polyprenyl-3-methyl-5-hydroxy-6-metoxy-1,4-benzoquinol methylase